MTFLRIVRLLRVMRMIRLLRFLRATWPNKKQLEVGMSSAVSLDEGRILSNTIDKWMQFVIYIWANYTNLGSTTNGGEE